MSVDLIVEILHLTWSNLWVVLNSNFSAALFGAGFGAYSANYIVEKQKNIETLNAEIRVINNAIAICFEFTNTAISFKDQHIKELYAEYKKNRKDYLSFVRGLSSNDDFIYQARLVTLDPPFLPIEKLNHLVFDKTTVENKIFIVLSSLTRSVEIFKSSIVKRNELIASINKKSALDKQLINSFYFGVKNKEGYIDESYPNLMHAINQTTDDCIFFSNFLSSLLFDHGALLAIKIGKNSPKISKPNFSLAEEKGLIPPVTNYTQFLDMFHKN